MGGHREPCAQPGAESGGMKVGSGRGCLSSSWGSLHVRPSGCPAVRLSGGEWLRTLGPRSGSRRGLGEPWGGTGAAVSQLLGSEHSGAQPSARSGPWARGLPGCWAPRPGQPSGASVVASADPPAAPSPPALTPGSPCTRPAPTLTHPHPPAPPCTHRRPPADSSRAQRQQSPSSSSSGSRRMARGGQRGAGSAGAALRARAGL